MIKLFDVQNKVIVPTEHCYNIKTLKAIMENYEDYMQEYFYLFYMTCPNPDMNPFFDIAEYDKEEIILRELGELKFYLEDDEVIAALDLMRKMYETPTLRMYMGFKTAVDNLGNYLRDITYTDGKDGNLTQVVNAAAKFDAIRKSYTGVYKDLMEEQKSTVRGGSQIAYDQKM